MEPHYDILHPKITVVGIIDFRELFYLSFSTNIQNPDLFLQNLILRTMSCSTGFITDDTKCWKCCVPPRYHHKGAYWGYQHLNIFALFIEHVAELCMYHRFYGTIDSMVLGINYHRYHMVVTSGMVLGKKGGHTVISSLRGLTPKKKNCTVELITVSKRDA